MLSTYVFSLSGVRCAGCVRRVETALKNCQHLTIKCFSVELVDKKLTVIVEDGAQAPSDVRRLLCESLVHFEPQSLDLDTPQVSPPQSLRKKIFRSHWTFGILGTIAGVVVLALSMSVVLPLAAMISIAVISVLLTLALGAESYIEATKKLFKMRALTMDTLFALSSFAAIAVSIGAFFIPGLPMIFDAGLLIFGFRHIGNAIEESIKQKMNLGASFKDRLPKKVALFVDEKSTVETALNVIKPQNRLLIKAGELIPVDGICDIPEGLVFDTIITGSTLPRKIVRGEPLLAGMYCAEGGPSLRMIATKPAALSYLARLDNNIALANYEKAPLETATDKILQYFIPSVIALAILTGIVISFFFPPALAIKCAVALFVSACPCTLGLVTPLAVLTGMKKAADNGVQFKSGKALQAAAQIDTVVFDLHGTLTTGVPVVRSYGVAPSLSLSAKEMLSYFSLLEKQSSHTIAKAICAFVNEQQISPPAGCTLTAVDKTNHSGITATINGVTYTVGNQTMMNDHGISTDEIQKNIHPEGGDSVIYLARAGRAIGHVIMTDPLRPHARHMIDSLLSLNRTGKKPMQAFLGTGADEATAQRYAKLLGIPPSHIRAGCVGETAKSTRCDKKIFLEELAKRGHRVAMIGDGANDALAVAACPFSMAVMSRGGDEVTQQQAGAVVHGRSLLPITSAFAVARQAVSNIKQNLLVSFGYNLGAMMLAGGLLLAIGLTLNPGVGVLLMILQTSLILLNVYRFKQKKLQHESLANVQDDPKTSSYKRLYANMPSQGAALQQDVTPTYSAGNTFCDLPSKRKSAPSGYVADAHVPAILCKM